MWWDVWSLWHDTWRPVPERRMKGEQLQQERAMSPVAIRLLFFRFLLLSSTIYSGCVSTRCKWANQAETGIRLSRSDFWRDRILIRSATGLSNQMNSRYEMKRPVHNNRFSIFPPAHRPISQTQIHRQTAFRWWIPFEAAAVRLPKTRTKNGNETASACWTYDDYTRQTRRRGPSKLNRKPNKQKRFPLPLSRLCRETNIYTHASVFFLGSVGDGRRRERLFSCVLPTPMQHWCTRITHQGLVVESLGAWRERERERGSQRCGQHHRRFRKTGVAFNTHTTHGEGMKSLFLSLFFCFFSLE